MSKPKPFISEKKKRIVSELVNVISKYEVIAVADMTGMPSLQLQKMRNSLKNQAEIIFVKASLLKVAIHSLKDKIKGIENLEQYVKGMPSLVLTNNNPFQLAKTLAKSKSPAPAKAGHISTIDVMVPEGPTPFAPGPIIGELGGLGIQATIDGGKVVIKKANF